MFLGSSIAHYNSHYDKVFLVFICWLINRFVCNLIICVGLNDFDNITDNPLYTDTRYNDRIRYNDNLNVMKQSLKRGQLMRNYARIMH